MKKLQKSVHTEEYRYLLDRLVALRKSRGMSQRALAKRLGVHHSWVAKVELGERRLDILELVRLLQALDIPALVFLKDVIGRWTKSRGR